MNRLPIVLIAASLVMPPHTWPQDADPFVGRFRHARMDLELVPSTAGYEGLLIVAGDRYQISAHQAPPGLVGSFLLEGHYYRFTGRVSKNGLTLWLPIAQTAGEIVWRLGEYKPIRYEFKRVTTAPDAPQRH